MLNKNATCFFTGHRIVRKEHFNIIKETLRTLIATLSNQGINTFITGGALGFDTIAAKSVLEAKEDNPEISLILALPCKNQSISWRAQQIEEYNTILSAADDVIYVSDEYYQGCMHKRNRYMADNSTHCIFYMAESRGGTAYTVKYALENELEMHNIMIKK